MSGVLFFFILVYPPYCLTYHLFFYFSPECSYLQITWHFSGMCLFCDMKFFLERCLYGFMFSLIFLNAGNYIKAEDVQVIADALNECVSLQVLDLNCLLQQKPFSFT